MICAPIWSRRSPLDRRVNEKGRLFYQPALCINTHAALKAVNQRIRPPRPDPLSSVINVLWWLPEPSPLLKAQLPWRPQAQPLWKQREPQPWRPPEQRRFQACCRQPSHRPELQRKG